MPATSVQLGAVANQLFSRPDVNRVAVITSLHTGNPALRTLNLQLPQELVSVQYQQYQSNARLDEVGAAHAGWFDAVLTDPFHTYTSSVHCLDVCVRLLRPGGLLLCHDCLPEPDLIGSSSLNEETLTFGGAWCGYVFAAFRDVMTAHGVAWCTLDADHGIGLAVAPPVLQAAPSSTRPPWTPTIAAEYTAAYLADPFTMMRAVQAERWEEALGALERGATLQHITARFTTWTRLVPPKPRALVRLLTRIARRIERMSGG